MNWRHCQHPTDRKWCRNAGAFRKNWINGTRWKYLRTQSFSSIAARCTLPDQRRKLCWGSIFNACINEKEPQHTHAQEKTSWKTAVRCAKWKNTVGKGKLKVIAHVYSKMARLGEKIDFWFLLWWTRRWKLVRLIIRAVDVTARDKATEMSKLSTLH